MAIDDIYFVQRRSLPVGKDEDACTREWIAWSTVSQESNFELATAIVELIDGPGVLGRVMRFQNFPEHNDDCVAIRDEASRAVQEAERRVKDVDVKELRARACELLRFRHKPDPGA